MTKELQYIAADLATLKFEVMKKVGDALVTFKHISSKNTDYSATESYLTFEHNEQGFWNIQFFEDDG